MMEEKKNDRPQCYQHQGRSKGSGACAASSDPVSQSTTSAPPGQALKIADFLSHSQENAIPLHDLVNITGLRERDLRRQIELERRSGVLIVSDNRRGYWLAAEPEEAQRFARSMLSRAREIRKTARAVEAAAERMAD